jgi:hypothetical protein
MALKVSFFLDLFRSTGYVDSYTLSTSVGDSFDDDGTRIQVSSVWRKNIITILLTIRYLCMWWCKICLRFCYIQTAVTHILNVPIYVIVRRKKEKSTLENQSNSAEYIKRVQILMCVECIMYHIQTINVLCKPVKCWIYIVIIFRFVLNLVRCTTRTFSVEGTFVEVRYRNMYTDCMVNLCALGHNLDVSEEHT